MEFNTTEEKVTIYCVCGGDEKGSTSITCVITLPRDTPVCVVRGPQQGYHRVH